MWQTQSVWPVRTAHISVLRTVNIFYHTIQHRAVLIIFPLNLQTITITQILSSGGEGALTSRPVLARLRYKSLLYAAVAIYSILVNIETDIYTDSILTRLYEKLSYSWTKTRSLIRSNKQVKLLWCSMMVIHPTDNLEYVLFVRDHLWRLIGTLWIHNLSTAIYKNSIKLGVPGYRQSGMNQLITAKCYQACSIRMA